MRLKSIQNTTHEYFLVNLQIFTSRISNGNSILSYFYNFSFIFYKESNFNFKKFWLRQIEYKNG